MTVVCAGDAGLRPGPPQSLPGKLRRDRCRAASRPSVRRFPVPAYRELICGWLVWSVPSGNSTSGSAWNARAVRLFPDAQPMPVHPHVQWSGERSFVRSVP